MYIYYLIWGAVFNCEFGFVMLVRFKEHFNHKFLSYYKHQYQNITVHLAMLDCARGAATV